eukprot:g3768.t1
MSEGERDEKTITDNVLLSLLKPTSSTSENLERIAVKQEEILCQLRLENEERCQQLMDEFEKRESKWWAAAHQKRNELVKNLREDFRSDVEYMRDVAAMCEKERKELVGLVKDLQERETKLRETHETLLTKHHNLVQEYEKKLTETKQGMRKSEMERKMRASLLQHLRPLIEKELREELQDKIRIEIHDQLRGEIEAQVRHEYAQKKYHASPKQRVLRKQSKGSSSFASPVVKRVGGGLRDITNDESIRSRNRSSLEKSMKNNHGKKYTTITTQERGNGHLFSPTVKNFDLLNGPKFSLANLESQWSIEEESEERFNSKASESQRHFLSLKTKSLNLILRLWETIGTPYRDRLTKVTKWYAVLQKNATTPSKISLEKDMDIELENLRATVPTVAREMAFVKRREGALGDPKNRASINKLTNRTIAVIQEWERKHKEDFLYRGLPYLRLIEFKSNER